MERLLQLTPVWLAILAIGSQPLLAQPDKEWDVCELRLTLISKYDGLPVRFPVHVKVVRSDDGEVWRSFETKDARLEVCDVEPHPFDLAIGGHPWGQWTIRRLGAVRSKTLDLKVTWPPYSLERRELPPWNGCSIHLAVRAFDGSSIPDAVISRDPFRYEKADSNGRAEWSVRAGDTQKTIIKAPGFQTSEQTFSCPQGYSGQSVIILLSRDEGKAGGPSQTNSRPGLTEHETDSAGSAK